MAFDAEFVDGFDKYGVSGNSLTAALFAGEWNTITLNGGSIKTNAALSGTGYCLTLLGGTGGNPATLQKTLGANYARMIGGVAFSSNLTGISTIHLVDTLSTTNSQVAIVVNTSGQIQAYRGASYTSTTPGGTLLGTASSTIAANAVHTLEWDITINNTTGIVKLWLDGVSVLSLTGQNTRNTANSYYNALVLTAVNTAGSSFNVDHLYNWYFLSGGGSETPLLYNPIVETQFPSSDAAVQFTPTAGVLGQDYSITANTNAPGANQLFLRRFTPLVNATINSVSILPGATSAAAKFKAVIYADSAGSPTGAPLSSGTEVVGCTSGTVLTGALVTPQSLTAGTPYWIGFITDTSVVLNQVDTTTTGAKAANTYTSGAPTSPTMTTGQASWIIFGNCTSPAANWAQVTNGFSNPPLGDLSYNADSTVGHADRFGFPALSINSQNIATVAVKGFCERSDAGARTIDLITRSNTTTSTGSNPAQSPGTSYGWLGSYFDKDPNGSITWTKSAVDAATSGYDIAT